MSEKNNRLEELSKSLEEGKEIEVDSVHELFDFIEYEACKKIKRFQKKSGEVVL